MIKFIVFAMLFWSATTDMARATVIECVVERVTDVTYICRDKTGVVFNLARGIGDYGTGDTIRHKTKNSSHYDDYEVLSVRSSELVLQDRSGNLITQKKYLNGYREGDLVRYVLPGTGLPADYRVVRNIAPLVTLRDQKGNELQLEREPGNLQPGDQVEYDRRRKKIRKDKDGNR